MNPNDKKTFFRNHIIIYENDLARYIWQRVYNENDATDILQTVFLNAWRSLGSLKSPEKAKSWLYVIASNCIKEHFRRQAKHLKSISAPGTDGDPYDILEHICEEEDAVLTEIIERFEAELAFQALCFLDTEDRELINMRYIDEIGIKRMVEITGLKEKTLSSKLSRALKKYKQIYFALEQGKEVEPKYGKKE